MLSSAIAVWKKDLQSELRTRASISGVLLFVVCSVLIILFSSQGEQLTSELYSAVLWIVMFFSAMTGMARSFTSEEDRGTSLYLLLSTPPLAVYLGKLIYNTVLGFVLTVCTVILLLFFFDTFIIANPLGFLISTIISTFGISVCTTITSAVVAKAGSTNALLPVLSLPLVLPVLFVGVDAVVLSIAGSVLSPILSDAVLILSYSVVVMIVSSWLFEYIWVDA